MFQFGGPKPRTPRRRPAASYAYDPWAPPPRRGRPALLAVGVLAGVAAGYLLTDPAAWRQVRRAAGFPVDARPDLPGRPGQVVDGDTFRLGAARVRLQGVDAPEMSTPDGQPARDHLADLIRASRGRLRCEDTGQRTYGRIVAQCFTTDGRDLSELMAEDGWATVMLRFSGWPYLPSQIRAMWRQEGMWNGFWAGLADPLHLRR